MKLIDEIKNDYPFVFWAIGVLILTILLFPVVLIMIGIAGEDKSNKVELKHKESIQ